MHLEASRVLSFVAAIALISTAAEAQNLTTLTPTSFPVAPAVSSPIGNLISKAPACHPYDLQAAKQLSFEQRACYFGEKLVAPSMLLRGLFSGAYGQWRNNDPHVGNEGMDDFGRRFGSFYARHTAQNAGELVAGYLHHEDPRLHVSGEHGFWNRTRAAFVSVVVSKDEDGDNRIALAPIAGSLGAGFVGMAVSTRHDHLEDGFRRSELSYGGYIGTALLHEFQPDLSAFASRLLHKKNPD